MKEDFTRYAEREFSIMRARMHDQLTGAEYRSARGLAYLMHGYITAARRSVKRGHL